MFHKLHTLPWLHLPEWILAIILVLFLGGCETFVYRFLLPNVVASTSYIVAPFVSNTEIPLVPNSRPDKTRPDGTKYTNLTIEQYQVYWKEAFPS